MRWIVNNWSFLVVVACVAGIIFLWTKKFVKLPSDEQIKKLKAWLLYAVIEAEKQYQSGTGRLKLAAVYAKFCEVFPTLVSIVSFELFSYLVDEALVEMRKLLESNKDIECYVNGE